RPKKKVELMEANTLIIVFMDSFKEWVVIPKYLLDNFILQMNPFSLDILSNIVITLISKKNIGMEIILKYLSIGILAINTVRKTIVKKIIKFIYTLFI